MNIRISALLIICCSFLLFDVTAQVTPADIHKSTMVYGTKDSLELKLDLFTNAKPVTKQPCVIFMFGGGFMHGERDNKLYSAYFQKLAQNNFKVISIDYRLGLKGQKWPTVFNTQVLKKAIAMAVSDLYDATAYLIANAEKLDIDTSMIIVSGSSAGAVATLQADWEKRNSMASTHVLPAQFQYKGVIAFAGAILSYIGKPVYQIPPAPTMMFHGTADKIVVYNKVKLFNRGMFGSAYLAELFKKKNYPYYFQSAKGRGHEIAGTPMSKNLDDIMWFIHTYIQQKKHYQMEVSFKDLYNLPNN
ncbi:alpha/beta hydrolase [Pedobacter frigoris]|uniref:Alpha/beta hydrolase n=1 Tax=Pedobacter frigoris TaxID=2571272 RepID=A0A4U1CLY1_9SPHI|nr:alpha/beta hydrolase [Pedobacter frigoris]TKC07341.1 alpha/beta hydrolase [Pedobacter frigoris]